MGNQHDARDTANAAADMAGEERTPARGGRGRLAAIAGLLALALGRDSATAQTRRRARPNRGAGRRNQALRTRRVERTVTLEPGVNDGLIVNCPRLMAAIGSGYSLPPSAAPDVFLFSSLPEEADSSRAWRFAFRNRHGRRVTATLYAVCVPVQR